MHPFDYNILCKIQARALGAQKREQLSPSAGGGLGRMDRNDNKSLCSLKVHQAPTLC